MSATIENNARCTGCGVCAYTCPTQAIKMARDRFGFIQPQINQEKCIKCGKCVSSCHSLREENLKNHKLYALCGWHKSDDVRMNSSSGGAFSAFAEQILSEGGVVFAHEFYPEEKLLQCRKVNSVENLFRVRTSKYVESNISDSISEIQRELKSGKKVLFVGSPCQTAAINNIFINQDNLITISFLCHGVSAPKAFQCYLEEKEKKEKNRIKTINFRDKVLGWHDCVLKLVFANGKKQYCHYSIDPYYYCDMVKSTFLRDACYNCQYHSHHISDVTIGDCWTIKSQGLIPDDNRGASIMIANTEKGAQLISCSKHRMVTFDIPIDNTDYAFWDASKNDNSKEIQNRIKFFDLMEKKGFSYAAKSQMDGWLIPRIKVVVKVVRHLLRSRCR